MLTAVGVALAVTLIPASVSATPHTVVKGEYLDKIARAKNMTWQQLHAANPSIQNPHLIFAGQVIEVPEAPVAHVEAPVAAPAPQPSPAPTPAPAPAPAAPVKAEAPAPAPAPAASGVAVPAILVEIRRCESGHNYTAQNKTSTASGAYQFLDSTWAGYGGYSRAMHAPAAVQDAAAVAEYNRNGTRPWNPSKHCWGA